MSVSLSSPVQNPQAMPWMDQEPQGSVLRFAADRQVYEEGDEARSFYKVVSGIVRTCQFLSDGRRQIDAFHLPGDVFGFEAGATHRLSARQFLAHAMACLAQSREHCLLLGRGSAAQKIAAFLLEMAERGMSDTVVELAMSRQDIADYLGLTIETVSRTFSQMERDGVIALPTTRRVLLKNRRALRDLNA